MFEGWKYASKGYSVYVWLLFRNVVCPEFFDNLRDMLKRRQKNSVSFLNIELLNSFERFYCQKRLHAVAQLHY